MEIKDTAYISIQHVSVDSFPKVKVRFTAETRKGFPFWNVAPEKILVRENTALWEVTSFKSLTRELPLQVYFYFLLLKANLKGKVKVCLTFLFKQKAGFQGDLSIASSADWSHSLLNDFIE